METVYDLEYKYPFETGQAIQNFGSDATSVSQLIEELANEEVDTDELEEQVRDEILNFVAVTKRAARFQ